MQNSAVLEGTVARKQAWKMYQKAPFAGAVPIQELAGHYVGFEEVRGARHTLQPGALQYPDQPRFAMAAGGASGTTTIDINPDQIDQECVRCFSPRSKKAMKQAGVTGDDIIDRPLEAFYEVGLPRHVQQLRCDVFRMNRAEAIALVSGKRRENIQAAQEAAIKEQRRERAKEEKTKEEMPKYPNGVPDGVNTSVEVIQAKEKARMDKLFARQKRELENMLAKEVKKSFELKKHEERMTYHEKRRQRGVDLMENDRAKELALTNFSKGPPLRVSRNVVIKKNMARKERSQNMQRLNKTQVVKNEEKSQGKSAENAMFAQTMNGRKNEKDWEHVREKNLARKRRVEERNEAFVEAQHQAFEQRSMELEFRELEREKAIARRTQEKIKKNNVKAEQANKRVQNAFVESERRILQNRKNMEEKMKHDEARLAAFHEKKALKRVEKLKKKKEKEERRDHQVQMSKKEHDQKMREIMKNCQEHEELLMKRDMQEQEKNEFMRELARLNEVRKMHNVARIKRQNEYQREQLIQKVNADARRAKEFEEAKQNLLSKRQQAQIQVDRQKREMNSLFNEMQEQSGDWKKLAGQTGFNYEDMLKRMEEQQVKKQHPPSAATKHYNYNPKQYNPQNAI